MKSCLTAAHPQIPAAKHRLVLFLIPFVVSVILRIYPYLFYHVPYSTDSWQPIYDAQQLIANSPTPLGGNTLFDMYNIYWPANSIFGAIGSLMIGADPIKLMPLIFPILDSVTILIFFLIAERLTGSHVVAFVASLLFATAGFYATFMAGITKEAYANPLYMLCILMLLWKVDKKSISVFALASLSLAIAHHATSFVFLAIAGSILVVTGIHDRAFGITLGRRWIFFLSAFGIISAYALLNFQQESQIFSSFENWTVALSLISFLAISLVPATYYSLSRPRRILPLEEAIMMGIALTFFLVSAETRLLPFAPIASSGVIFYAVPYFVVGMLAITGYRIMQARMNRSNFAFVSAWLLALIALEGFALFSGVAGSLGIVYRLFDFVYAPVAILGGVALFKLYGGMWGKRKNVIRAVVVVALVGIALWSASETYAASIENSNIFGGHWAYQPSDLIGGEFIKKFVVNASVAGDSKVSYLLFGYLRLNVDIGSGYNYLIGAGPSPNFLVTYSEMIKNGYVLDPYAFPLPYNWSERLQNESSLVYSNGNVAFWSFGS